MRAFVALTALGGIMAVLTGCAGPKEYEPYSASDRTLFMPSVRTVGPDPVYARTRWVRPPDVLPQRDMPGQNDAALGDSPSLRTVFQLSLKDATLEESARVLAATARYSSYTAPSIAEQKISIKNIETIHELGRIRENKAQVQVVVDHANREVRFLAAEAQSPRLFEE